MLTVLLAPMRKKDIATRREEATRKGFTDVLFLHKVNQLVALSYILGRAGTCRKASPIWD